MVKGMRPGVHDIHSGRDRENHPQDCRRAQAATTLKGIGRSRLMEGFSVEVSILLQAGILQPVVSVLGGLKAGSFPSLGQGYEIVERLPPLDS